MRSISIALILIMIAASLTHTVEAQPRHMFVAVVRGTLYPGEEGEILTRIYNNQCVSRIEEVVISYAGGSPYSSRLKNVNTSFIGDIIIRALWLKYAGYLEVREGRGYVIELSPNEKGERIREELPFNFVINSFIEYDGYTLFNITVWLFGVCVGEQVDVKRVRVWFPFHGYGRSLSSEVEVNKKLNPPDPIRYFFEGILVNNATVKIPFRVPADILSQDLGDKKPTVEVDTIYHGSELTFGGAGLPTVEVYGMVKVMPYRTFNLRVTDNEGNIPLAGARVRLKAHVYPFETELVTDERGVAHIVKLPDQYNYTVYVNFSLASLGTEVEMIAAETVSAWELAASPVLRTELYTLRVRVLDIYGATLDGAQVSISPVEVLGRRIEDIFLRNATQNGYATFYLMPTGNYTVTATWRGVEVYRSRLRVDGNIDTELKSSVFRVVFKLVDMDGDELKDAIWRAEGPGLSLSGRGSSVELGLIPDSEHFINVSIEIGGWQVEVLSLSFKPSEIDNRTLTVPLGRLRMQVLWSDGESFQGRVKVAGEDIEIVSGRAETKEKHLAGTYRAVVYGPMGEPAAELDLRHAGETLRVTIEPLTVRVFVKDWLEKPVAGANVMIIWSGAGFTLSSGHTGPDGSYVSRKIPVGLQLTAKAMFGEYVVEENLKDKVTELRIPALIILGVAINPFLIIMSAIAAALITATILIYRRLRRRAG